MKVDALASRYRFIAELGHGGMADVYLVTAQGAANFHKLLVVKQLREAFANDAEFVTMFLDEARLAARLNHPNVIHVYDVGEQQGAHYLAMEYVEGQSLHGVYKKLGRRGVPLRVQLRVLADVLAGLHHAHQLCDFDGRPLAVVHRDVSPHNVLVAYDGQVKVVDFGIAKALDATSQTSSGVIKGKVAYMAPEQASADRQLDGRADVFAVGIMLWEALTGERFYEGLTNQGILVRLLRPAHDFPAPSSRSESVDPQLEAICRRALAWDKQDRYPSAREMQYALDRYLLEHGGPVASEEVGAVVREHFASERASLREAVEAAITQSRSSSGWPMQATTDGPAALRSRAGQTGSNSSRLTTGQQASTALDVSFERTETKREMAASLPAPATDPWRPRWPLAFVAGATLVALGLILARSTSPLLTAPATSSASAPGATARGEGEPRVRVQLRARPAGAQLYWDDEPLGPAPFVGTRLRDDRRHRVRITAPDHEPNELEVTLDQDVSLEISLELAAPATTPALAPAPSVRSKPTSRPAGRPLATSTTPSTPSTPPTIAPVKKGPGFDNPFGD